jgi:hypothetical protein
MSRYGLAPNVWRCIGCGKPALAHGDSDCDCPSGLLYRPAHLSDSLTKVSRLDERLNDLRRQLQLTKNMRRATVRKVRREIAAQPAKEIDNVQVSG